MSDREKRSLGIRIAFAAAIGVTAVCISLGKSAVQTPAGDTTTAPPPAAAESSIAVSVSVPPEFAITGGEATVTPANTSSIGLYLPAGAPARAVRHATAHAAPAAAAAPELAS